MFSHAVHPQHYRNSLQRNHIKFHKVCTTKYRDNLILFNVAYNYIPPAVTTVIGISNVHLLIPNLSQNSLEMNEVVAPVSNRTLPGLVRILSVPITACSE